MLLAWLLFCTGKRKRPIWLPYARIVCVYVYIYYMYLMLWPTVIIMNVRLWYAKKFLQSTTTTCSNSNWASCNGSSARKGVASGRQHSHVCACVCVCHSSCTHTRCDAPLKIQVTAAGDKVRPVRSASDANVQGLGAGCLLLLLLGWWCQ